MKNLLIILAIAIMATGCSGSKPTTSTTTTSHKKSSLTFIDDISVQPQSHREKTGASYDKDATSVVSPGPTAFHSSHSYIEAYSPLRFKYAILMDATVEELNNTKLLNFIEDWYGIHYHYGGTTRDGIDCSAFVCSLLSEVYGISNLPRISKDQYSVTRRVPRGKLQEGDLVFFHTLGKHKAVTHVGVYLRNNKFFHASISGVMINDMNEGYYLQHYIGAGRVM